MVVFQTDPLTKYAEFLEVATNIYIENPCTDETIIFP